MHTRSPICWWLAAGLIAGLVWLPGTQAQEAEPASLRVIVKWREQISLATRSSAASLALRDAEARVGVSASAMHATGSGAEVLRLSRALSQTEMTQFLAALGDSPEVEYAEEDLDRKSVV